MQYAIIITTEGEEYEGATVDEIANVINCYLPSQKNITARPFSEVIAS